MRAVELNDQLCARARELAVDAAGAREMTGAILGSGVVSGLIDAIRELFSRRSERDALVRKTIQQQLEEARWRSFADIPALA